MTLLVFSTAPGARAVLKPAQIWLQGRLSLNQSPGGSTVGATGSHRILYNLGRYPHIHRPYEYGSLLEELF
jgi:hypothetical protein